MTPLEELYRNLTAATLDSPQGELLSTMLLHDNADADPEIVLQELAALQDPWNPVGIPETIKANGQEMIPPKEFMFEGQSMPQPTKESGYAIPEFAKDPEATSRPVGYKDPIGDAPKVDTKQTGAIWRDTLNVYERTPEGGVRVRQIKDIPNAVKPTAPEILPTSVFQGIKGLASIEDPITRNEAYANLVGEVEKYKIQIQTNTANQIEAQLGIPRLLEAIRMSEERDRQNPDPLARMADSPVTQSLRKQLDSQRQRAALLTEEQLKSNVTLVGLATQMATAETLIKRMETSDARKDQKEFERDLRNEAIRDQVLMETSPQAIDRAMVLDPSLQGKDPAEVALHLRKTRRTPEAFAALEAPPERLTQLALVEGNIEAGKILVHEESRRTGEPPELIEGKLKQIRKIAEDPKEFQKAMTSVLRLSGDDMSAMTRQMATAVTKEDKAQLRARKYELAVAAYGKLQEAEFMGNVQSWAGADPEIAGALSKAQQTTGASDIQSVFAAYVGDLQGQARVQKENEFYGKIRANAALRNKSLIGGIDSQAIIARLQQERAKSLLEAAFQGLPIFNRATQIIENTVDQMNPVSRVAGFFRGE